MQKEGFRRAGFTFSGEPTIIDTDKSKLTDDQIKELKADPMLVVVDGETPVAAKGDKKLATALDEAQKELGEANKTIADLTAQLDAVKSELDTLKAAKSGKEK